MKDINLLSLDLELNKPTNSIIQVGCVVGNLASGKILEEYSAYINTGEVIDPFITNLTGIKQEDVDNGISLFTAYEQLKQLHIKHECRNRGCVLTWGIGDMRCLREALHLDEEAFYFGRRFIDVKTVFISYQWANNLTHQAGLAKALTKVGLCFDGKKHSAKDDAKNTWHLFNELLKRFNYEN
jgi:inhibitor of KinA sporulation pathway (predicted exonuclease)